MSAVSGSRPASRVSYGTRLSRTSSFHAPADDYNRFTLRFHDKKLEAEYRLAFARQLKTAMQIVYPLIMIFGLGLLMVCNEVLDEDDWVPSHRPGSVISLGVGVAIGVGFTYMSLIHTEFWVRRLHSLTLVAGTVVLVEIILAGLMVGQADQPFILATVSLALGVASYVFPFYELAAYNTGLTLSYTVLLMLDDATATGLGSRAVAALVVLLGYCMFGAMCYYTSMGRRELFLLRRRLERENRKLHTRLREFESLGSGETDMDGPILKVVSALQTLRVKHGADEEDRDKLSMALAVIVQRDMFNTRIADNVQTDGDTKAYLASELGQRRGLVRRRSTLADRRRISGPQGETPTVALLLPHEEAKLSELLGHLDQWSLDIFQIAEVSNGRPLQVVGMRVFEQLGLLERFKIDAVVLRAFLGKIEAGYNKVPYHTSTHAADVLHGVYYLCRNEVAKRYLSDVDVLALAIAAVIHDYQHPGINNNFLIATGHELAVLYNDRSVLENHHVASAFAAMAAEPNINILRDMEEDERKTVRRLVIEFVLATDFSKHFEILNQFKGKLSGDGLSDIDPDDALLLCKVLIKMADISNVTKGPELSRKWADAVMAEFWAQGDKEREAGLPVSTFFDRREPLVAKCQSSFIGFLVRPLAAPVFELLEEPGLLQQVDENKRDWDRKLGP